MPAFFLEDITPTRASERFFDEHVIGHVVENTNRFAKQKGNHTFSTSSSEIKAFLAMLFISGYSTVPRRPMYWEPAGDVHNAAVAKIMTRNRFDSIMQFSHVADNDNLLLNDRMAKVRPHYNLLSERCVRFFPLQQELSVDESMIPYFGRHSMKQCIRSKPIRFGFKQWVIATPLG